MNLEPFSKAQRERMRAAMFRPVEESVKDLIDAGVIDADGQVLISMPTSCEESPPKIAPKRNGAKPRTKRRA